MPEPKNAGLIWVNQDRKVKNILLLLTGGITIAGISCCSIGPHFTRFVQQVPVFMFQVDAVEDYYRDAGKQLDEQRMIIAMPPPKGEWQWTGQQPEAPPVRKSEKIIRQELRDDGLVIRGKQYIVELNNRYMYINGVRQPREIYKKYRKLVESLESLNLESGGNFKMIF